MKKFSKRKKSVFQSLFCVIFLVSMILIGLFGTAISHSHILGKLRASKVDNLENIVEMRKRTLENQMISGWTNSDNLENAANQLESLNPEDWGNEVQTQRAEVLLSILGNVMATGAYYIPLEENEKGVYDAIYFRDINPETYSRTYSDIYGEYGNSEVMKNLGITLDSNWRAYAGEELAGSSYVTRIVEAYRENPSGSEMDYGCFTVDTIPYFRGVSCIMHTIPLLNEQGEVAAVLGVEISMEYVNTFLNYEELTLKENSAYLLGIYDEETDSVTPVTTVGPQYKSEIMKMKTFCVKDDTKWVDVSRIAELKDGKDLVFQKQMNLYNPNTPFYHEKWCLYAIQSEERLFQNENTFQTIIVIITIFSVVVAIAGSYLGSKKLEKPVKTVYEAVTHMEPMKNLEIKRVNIKEIDRLSEAIEEMGRDIIRSASRMASIIKDAELKVGVIEADKEKDICYVTYSCCTILEMEHEEADYLLMTHEELNEFLQKFYAKATIYCGTQNHYSEDNNVYEMVDKSGQSRWISFATREDEEKILIILSDVTDSITKEMKLEYEVSHDALSGLFNHKAFRKEVEKRLLDGNAKIGAMCMWDLDNLKYVNDSYGHEYGDLYIKMAAKCLATLERQGGIVSRRSGDEFYVYIDGEDKDELRDILYALHEMLGSQKLILQNGETLKLRGSAGIAWYPEDAGSYEELNKKADFAMYSVKHSNKGIIAEFSQKQYERDEILFSGNEELNRFIEERRLKMAYQPIVDGKTGEIFAYEALMRPKMEKLKTPLDVIRLAKSQSRLMDIERLTWETALEDYFIAKNGGSGRKLFVNSFPNALLSRESEEVCGKKYGRYFSNVVVEMTENDEMNDMYMERKKEIAKNSDMEFALDDFGSGFNSEMKIIQLRPGFIKIDKTFVENITEDTYRQEMVNNTIDYCKRHNIRVIAEGVETAEELSYMLAAGADYIQGYYLARPQEKQDEIRQKIKEGNENGAGADI